MPSSPTDPGAAATGTASGTAPQRHGDGRPRRSTLWINLALALASTVVLFLVIEGFSSVLMSIRAAKHTLLTREESHSQYDADLGWRHQPDVRIDDLYGGKTSFSTNARGSGRARISTRRCRRGGTAWSRSATRSRWASV